MMLHSVDFAYLNTPRKFRMHIMLAFPYLSVWSHRAFLVTRQVVIGDSGKESQPVTAQRLFFRFLHGKEREGLLKGEREGKEG